MALRTMCALATKKADPALLSGVIIVLIIIAVGFAFGDGTFVINVAFAARKPVRVDESGDRVGPVCCCGFLRNRARLRKGGFRADGETRDRPGAQRAVLGMFDAQHPHAIELGRAGLVFRVLRRRDGGR